MARASTLPIYNRALRGKLIPLLREWTAAGDSLVLMSHKLRDLDVAASPETVRRWIRELDAESAPSGDAA